METKKEKAGFRFPFYVTKKIGLAPWKYWLIRVGGILLAFLLTAVVCNIVRPGSFGMFFVQIQQGCFDFTDFSTFIDLFAVFAVLLLISLALVPAFKMKFWNIGAEGQILAGCTVATLIAKYISPSVPDFVVMVLCLVGAIAAGIFWSVIPAIFKALFNTNETLFTLMMNYIAIQLAGMFYSFMAPNNRYESFRNAVFPEVFDTTGFFTIIFAILIFVLIFFYIKKSIHGYEISVVGESINTARYVGINVKKVIIRTMIFAGAIMGFIGFLIVCDVNHGQFNNSIVGGQGFTGVLIAWLGHFEPAEIALFSFLTAIMSQTTSKMATPLEVPALYFGQICTGIFFFVIIACEFFSNYQVKVHRNKEFEEFYSGPDSEKKERIKSTSNKFIRFWKWFGYYISYPFSRLRAYCIFNKTERIAKEANK